MLLEHAEVVTSNEIRCPSHRNQLGKICFILSDLLQIYSKNICDEGAIVQNVDFQSGRIDQLNSLSQCAEMANCRELRKSGNLRVLTFAGFGTLNGKASTVSCIGHPCFVHRRKADSMAGPQSAMFILVRLFLRYALETRTDKTFSATSERRIDGACIVHCRCTENLTYSMPRACNTHKSTRDRSLMQRH